MIIFIRLSEYENILMNEYTIIRVETSSTHL